MIPLPTAATRAVVLLGDPVHHSLSPTFQNAAFRAAGVDGVYLALRCDAGPLPAVLRAVAAAGGAGNVTVPHKALAAAALGRRTAAVERTGACNTFWFEDDAVCGDNTDVQGVRRAVAELLGAEPRGARVLLLGAGGAARAAASALVECGAAEVVVRNRTSGAARRLADTFDSPRTRVVVQGAHEPEDRSRFDLAINATSLGLRDDDPFPLDPERCTGLDAALDLVYRPHETAWVRALRARGIPAADGLGMLLHQGAAAFELWWRRPAPLEVMRAALPPRTLDGSGRLGAPAG